MGLFDKLFGKEQETLKQENIFQILGLYVNQIPDDSFTKGETDKNASGQLFTNYRKISKEKIAGIFDLIEVKKFEEGTSKNISVSITDYKQVNSNTVKALVEKLFLIYGTDAMGKGRFTSDELDEINSDWWAGRMWTDHNKYEYPIMFSLDDEGYKLAIWVK